MKMLKSISNFFTRIACYVVGWNYNILQECGEASHRTLKKYASSLTILTIIWGLVGYCFAERYIGLESILPKLLVSLVFITIIIYIERFILLTVGKPNVWMSSMRMILALLMAILGSTIFDQIIFKNDVEVEMKTVRTEQINEEIPKQIKYLDADIHRLTNLIDSIGKENIRLYAEWHKNPVLVATDVNTVTKQTGVDEDGKPIKEKITSVNRRNVENPLGKQVKANEVSLQMYQTELAGYQKKKTQIADIVRENYENAKNGFLEELNALINILSNSTIAFVFYCVLFAFLISLELLVVFSKIKDQSCDYDLVVEHQLRMKQSMLEKTEKKLLNIDEGNKTNN